MTSQRSSGQDDRSIDGAPEQATPADDAAFAADLWGDGFADAFSDASTNWFSAEIENVSASDWDIDTAQIWDGDDGADDDTDGGDAVGGDFPM